MTIAHIVCTFPPYYGGMGNVVLQTVSELSRRGHDVAVYTPAYDETIAGDTQKQAAHFAKQLKPAIQYGNAAYMPKIARELDNADIVHLHYPFFGTANLVRRWKLRHPDRPLVITYHMDTRAPGWKGLFFKYYNYFWMPKILAAGDRIITSSFDYIQGSDARSIYDGQKEKWVEIPFGVDIDRFTPREKPAGLLTKHTLDPNAPILLFVGGMDAAHYFKGVPIFIEALAAIAKTGKRVQTIFVGDGELREQFEVLTRMYRVHQDTHFVGKVSPESLPYYYNLADVCILPSINRGEAFGMVLLEAMASGVPVIASDLPGVRAVTLDGGLVFEPSNVDELAETILGYLSTKTDHVAWQKKARAAAVEKYSWKRHGDELEKVYNELI